MAKMRSPLIACSVTLTMALCRPAAAGEAEPPGEPTLDIYATGKRAYEEPDYELAAICLKFAHLARRSSKTARALARSLEFADGGSEEAMEMYETLLTRFRGQIDDEIWQAAVTKLIELRSSMGRLTVFAPVEATVAIDGRYRGRLPLLPPVYVTPGNHRLVVVADGQGEHAETFSVVAGGRVSISVPFERPKVETVHLVAPSPPPPSRPSIFRGVEALTGLVVGATLGSTAEQQCSTGSCSFVRGPLVGARVAFRLPRAPEGLSLEAGLFGFLLFSSPSRAVGNEATATFDIHDQLQVNAAAVSVGGSYHGSWTEVLGGIIRLHVAVGGTRSRDVISAVVTGAGAPVDAYPEGKSDPVWGGLVMLVPEAGMTFTRGRWRASVGVAGGVQLANGPEFAHGLIFPVRGDCASVPVSCAKFYDASHERAYGRFFIAMPSVSASYTF